MKRLEGSVSLPRGRRERCCATAMPPARRVTPSSTALHASAIIALPAEDGEQREDAVDRLGARLQLECLAQRRFGFVVLARA